VEDRFNAAENGRNLFPSGLSNGKLSWSPDRTANFREICRVGQLSEHSNF
jgi:hypothetical protein